MLLNPLSKPKGGAPSEGWQGSYWRASQEEAGASGGTATWKLVAPPIPLFDSSCHRGAATCEMTRLFPNHSASGGSWEVPPPHPNTTCWLPAPAQYSKVQVARWGWDHPLTSLLWGHRIDVLHPCQSSSSSWILGNSSTENRNLSGISAAKLVALATYHTPRMGS